MQRSQSALEFSSLLNPDPSEPKAPDASAQKLEFTPPASKEEDMATVTVIRPNGPLPGDLPAPILHIYLASSYSSDERVVFHYIMSIRQSHDKSRSAVVDMIHENFRSLRQSPQKQE